MLRNFRRIKNSHLDTDHTSLLKIDHVHFLSTANT
jgi:hypothetical protein